MTWACGPFAQPAGNYLVCSSQDHFFPAAGWSPPSMLPWLPSVPLWPSPASLRLLYSFHPSLKYKPMTFSVCLWKCYHAETPVVSFRHYWISKCEWVNRIKLKALHFPHPPHTRFCLTNCFVLFFPPFRQLETAYLKRSHSKLSVTQHLSSLPCLWQNQWCAFQMHSAKPLTISMRKRDGCDVFSVKRRKKLT